MYLQFGKQDQLSSKENKNKKLTAHFNCQC